MLFVKSWSCYFILSLKIAKETYSEKKGINRKNTAGHNRVPKWHIHTRRRMKTVNMRRVNNFKKNRAYKVAV